MKMTKNLKTLNDDFSSEVSRNVRQFNNSGSYVKFEKKSYFKMVKSFSSKFGGKIL